MSTWGLIRDSRAPFVGRGPEQAILDEALLAAKRGETRVVSIIGPAGVGKSRLVQELILRHRAPGVRPPGAVTDPGLSPRVYRGSARSVGAAFEVFAKLLRARFGLVDGMSGDSARTQVREQIAAVLDGDKVGDVAYFLGQLAGVPFEQSPLTRAVEDDAQQASLLRRAILKAFLEADAATCPTCLIFEDLHEAHDDSLALLRSLIEYLGGPVLILCVARPELLARQEEWGRAGERRHRVIELGPLADEEARTVMRSLLAPCEGGPPAELVQAACAYAGGLPELLEQVVRVFHDKGVLSEVTAFNEETRWRVDTDQLARLNLRLSVEDAITARLSALDEYEGSLLERAAAMGAVFWTGALVPLDRIGAEAPSRWDETADVDRQDLAEALLDLSLRDYIVKLPDSSFAGSDEYAWRHQREREALAKRTQKSALRRYHQSIADWMEHQEALRHSHEHVAMLADHRERAGDALQAGLAFLEAGDVARARYASSRASDYYERGLGLLGEAFPSRRIDALHHFGDVLFSSGRVDDALAAFREMLSLAYRLDRKGKGGAAHNRIGRLYRDTGSLDEAGKHITTGLALFRAAEDERGVASSIDDIGKLHWLKGEYDDALVALRDGLARRRKLGDRRSIALSLNNLGLVLQDSGNFREAASDFSQSLQIRREIGDLMGVVHSLTNLGNCAQDLRDFPRALGLLTEALEVAKQIGDRNRTALVLTNIGELHYRTGKPEEAIDVLRQAEELCDELGDKLGLAETLRGLGKAYMHKGDLPKARDAIRRAVDLFAEVRSKVHLGIALRSLGEITAAGGWGTAHTKVAREYFARAVAIFEQTGNDVELARTYKVFSKFLFDGDAKTDEAAKRDALGMNTRAEAIFTRLRITAVPSDVLTGRGALPVRP